VEVRPVSQKTEKVRKDCCIPEGKRNGLQIVRTSTRAIWKI